MWDVLIGLILSKLTELSNCVLNNMLYIVNMPYRNFVDFFMIYVEWVLSLLKVILMFNVTFLGSIG